MSRHPILYSLLFVFLAFGFFAAVFFAVVTVATRSPGAFFASGSIAVVEIEGAIFDAETTIKELHDYQENDSIKAVILRIDSPGGAVAPSQEIYEEVKKLRKTKKVIVSMGTVAASGGYYIACAGDKIFASPGTITGSIGVIMESFGFQDLMDWAHVESRVIKTGAFKDVGSPFRKMQPEEVEYLKGILENMYLQFKLAVSQSRNIPMEKVDELAQGKIYTGAQAMQLGLVDEMGTIYDAIEEAKKLAGLPQDAGVIWPKEPVRPLEWLLDSSEKTKTQDIFERLTKMPFNGRNYPLWLFTSDGQAFN